MNLKGIKQATTIKHNSQKSENFEAAEISEKFPNPGVIQNGEARDAPDNNYFIKNTLDECRIKWLKVSVYMETLNGVLELTNNATMEQLANRIHDLAIKAKIDEA